MSRPVVGVLGAVVMVVLIVTVDVLCSGIGPGERLAVNVGIVAVFAAVYLWSRR